MNAFLHKFILRWRMRRLARLLAEADKLAALWRMRVLILPPSEVDPRDCAFSEMAKTVLMGKPCPYEAPADPGVDDGQAANEVPDVKG